MISEQLKVMIAYDGSDYADAAIADLRRVGLPRDAEVLLTPVADLSAISPEVTEFALLSAASLRVKAVLAKEERVFKETANTALKAVDWLRSQFPEWNVRYEILQGLPAAELLRKAAEWKPDLIVAGSQGRSVVGRFFLGSVLKKITAEAECSVRVARVSLGKDADAPIKSSPARAACPTLNGSFAQWSKKRRELFEQARVLRAADVIVLNEVDYAMRRTDYRNIAGDLARRLGMNCAFGVQFIELSAVHFSQESAPDDPEMNEILQHIKVNQESYRGLHGVAVLSRFPLENVRLVPFKEQPYDWYKDEKSGISPLEKGKRLVSKKVFLEESTREVRRGGRSTLYADIADARFPEGRVTVAATHLENRARPAGRVKQLEELLANVKEVRHPVVVAGDMNTSSTDLKPTSLKRELAKRYGSPAFWIKKALPYSLSFGLLFDLVKAGTVYWRRSNDPTVRHIPLIAPNPGRRFFTTLKDFRFSDGGAFDFRGEPTRSTDKRGRTLSGASERAWKGFVTTYKVKRPIAFLGKNKLDWIFVKPARLTNPTDRRQSYRFTPHFGRTLTELNEILEERISDHRPLIVYLPLGEPNMGKMQKEAKSEYDL